jgi:tRNA pseudouridine55 synthase
MNGIINVLKPSGMTSHDIVNFIRKKLKIKKVGHTGTLDPNAAGVLPICLGKGTKITQYLIDDIKKYRCELTLGMETDTQDKYGTIVNKSDVKVSENKILNVIKSFQGEIKQIPPMYSAVKHKGKKLYELAREGKNIERDPRKVTIYNIDVINIKNNRRILFDVECSKGTYIRTLCNDIGRELGTYGYMSFLLRTRVGNFNLTDTVTIEEIEDLLLHGKLENKILPLDYPLVGYKKIILNESTKNILINGGKVPINGDSIDTIKEKYRVYCGSLFIGIGSILFYKDKKYVKIEKLLM